MEDLRKAWFVVLTEVVFVVEVVFIIFYSWLTHMRPGDRISIHVAVNLHCESDPKVSGVHRWSQLSSDKRLFLQ